MRVNSNALRCCVNPPIGQALAAYRFGNGHSALNVVMAGDGRLIELEHSLSARGTRLRSRDHPDGRTGIAKPHFLPGFFRHADIVVRIRVRRVRLRPDLFRSPTGTRA